MDNAKFNISRYFYELPESAIAQHPPERREKSRLLLVDRSRGDFREAVFADFPNLLAREDAVVFNNVRVIPARLAVRKKTGGLMELLLTGKSEGALREAVVRGRAREGLVLGPAAPQAVEGARPFEARLARRTGPETWLVEFSADINTIVGHYGNIPLPPYIKREAQKSDLENYQTVYAEREGAVAAPTAGLHFTREILDEMDRRGTRKFFLTLHVGWGTFRPVRVEDIREHRVDSEMVEISAETAREFSLEKSRGKRVTAVGTTVVRALEGCWREGGLAGGENEVGIFIYPGYSFRVVDRLLTNFHLPGTTTLLMTAAFCGWDILREAYQFALRRGFRFGSYGDCMYIR